MPAPLTSAQEVHVERLYQYLRVQHAAPESVLKWFRAIPRHRFLETVYLPERGTGTPREAVHIAPETNDPALLESIYADSALSIQLCGGICTSSTSQPSLMAQMMSDAELGPGKRVLEIGTASGWNAALMSGVVGPDGEVVSVEVDRLLATAARQRLAAEGVERVRVVEGDGYYGAPGYGPFDAVVVTVACPGVPRAWLEQMAEDGKLITPFALPDGSAPMLRLVRQRGSCSGRFVRQSWFVSVRGGPWENWPEPLSEQAPALATLRRLPERRRALPWGKVGDGRQLHEALGLFLLLHEPERTITIREGDGRPGIRYALRVTNPDGLAVIGDHELACYGDPAADARLQELLEAWIEGGSPRLYDYRITVDGKAPLVLTRAGTALAFEL
ncbi:MAG: protein-L-isoaspartate O-methyltransferase [Armatimonadetes bacterium]|nr:protein-L-isoaspartate O-methyltransferase [Armatimonadota bacterium]